MATFVQPMTWTSSSDHPRRIRSESSAPHLQGSKTFELDGYQIPYIGKAALIANKKAAGRHKDLADVEELERPKEG